MTHGHSAVLVLPCGQVEVLPTGTHPSDALDQGPLFSTCLSSGKVLYWSSGYSTTGQVNGFATQIVGHQINGDVCIVDARRTADELFAWLDKVTPSRYSSVVISSKAGCVSPDKSLAHGRPLAVGSPHGSPRDTNSHSPHPPAGPSAPPPCCPPCTDHATHVTHVAPHRPSKDFSLHSPSENHSTDPRQALLWAIAGRATSLSWTTATPLPTAPPPSAAKPTPRSSPPPTPLAAPGDASAQLSTSPPEASSVFLSASSPPSRAILPSLGFASGHQLPTVAARLTTGQPHEPPTGLPLPLPLPPSPAGQDVLQCGPPVDVQTGAAAHSRPVEPPSGTPLPATGLPMGTGSFVSEGLRHHGMGSAADPHGPAWGDLAGELLGLVLHAFQNDATSAVAMSGVCRKWRHALMLERQQLLGLKFRLDPDHPLKCHGRAVPVHLLSRMECPSLPALMHTAAVNGNCCACVALGSVLDQQGQGEEGIKYWKRAARLGEATAQIKLGMAHYKGSYGVPQDAEEALLWLSRGAKALMQHDNVPLLPFATLLLGYLHLDGEATRVDLGEAVKWFKVSARCGSKEAEHVLGTLFNSGQYG